MRTEQIEVRARQVGQKLFRDWPYIAHPPDARNRQVFHHSLAGPVNRFAAIVESIVDGPVSNGHACRWGGLFHFRGSSWPNRRAISSMSSGPPCWISSTSRADASTDGAKRCPQVQTKPCSSDRSVTWYLLRHLGQQIACMFRSRPVGSMLLPVHPRVGAYEAAGRAHHARAKRWHGNFVGTMINIHRGSMAHLARVNLLIYSR